MLFVQHPDDFQRALPGFLPPDLMPLDSLPGEPDAGSFSRHLQESLFHTDAVPWKTTAQPVCAPTGFWTSWYLATEASVSQYDTLRRVIGDRQDLPGHVVCLALSGKGFHGQQGRTWEAVRGNLHLSLALRCDLAAADCGLALTMLPAVAVVDALAALAKPRSPLSGLGIKWVNDILVDGRKIGGVLTSARSQDGRIGSCVLGIGLNVGSVPAVRPTPFTPGVTCFNEHITLSGSGLKAVLGRVLKAVATRFQELADQGPGPLLAAYRNASLVLGHEVEIRPDDNSSATRRRGRVLAIGPDLALTLTDDPKPVTTGRLVLLP
jgi:biotin-[acetyl-CoA-carboxylase] ligase BirA-like protein